MIVIALVAIELEVIASRPGF
jgi:hypothetical protein